MGAHRPRWWHHLRAFLAGRFWIPCPLCGRMFGGHECAWWVTVPSGEGRGGWLVCWRCDDQEAVRRGYRIERWGDHTMVLGDLVAAERDGVVDGPVPWVLRPVRRPWRLSVRKAGSAGPSGPEGASERPGGEA